MLADEVRARNALPRLITNLATFATFPLIGALLIRWGINDLHIGMDDPGFPLLVLAVFMVTNLINFLMIAGDHCFHARVPLSGEFQKIFVPVLPSELISALLCALVVAVYVRTGVPAMALMVLVLRRLPVPAAVAAALARARRAARLAAGRRARRR